jgi:hypothetical protein
MVQFYVKRIREGKMTLDDVPAMWYDEVKQIIDGEDGTSISGGGE